MESMQRVDDEPLAHIASAHSENIDVLGAIEVDVDGELAQLGPTGYRRLRISEALFSPRPSARRTP
ncbi:hypothetical protein [Yinghuangia seranimata]|uniref:hypothetical protein n=1 Tax=Yinghuangia seranimata TaxID=408067 RepID=UPI00248AFE4F|nr:hypothetical protein [Yinghuangia seranimata]MDI2130531.1 hypothetical protein [Yinghuangia seranimata]